MVYQVKVVKENQEENQEENQCLDANQTELIGSFLNFVASMRFPDSYKGRGLLISNKPKVKLKKGKVKS